MTDIHATAHGDTPTRMIGTAETRFAYGDLGPQAGVPVILVNHLGATLGIMTCGWSTVWRRGIEHFVRSGFVQRLPASAVGAP